MEGRQGNAGTATYRMADTRMLGVLLLHLLELEFLLCALRGVHLFQLLLPQVFLLQLVVLELRPTLLINLLQVCRCLDTTIIM